MAGVDDVLRWWGRLGSEVARMPQTMARGRRLLVELPDTLERLIAVLQGPLEDVGRALPELATRVEDHVCVDLCAVAA